MPTDIRSFFGGKTSTPIREKETKKEEDSKKKRSSKLPCGCYDSMILFQHADMIQKAARSLMIVMTMNPSKCSE